MNNDMWVLLISDPDAARCGAALRVDIGSANEPKGIPGLAHFLEHMLFFGSDKYNNPNLFFDFVGKY
jgi:secreted Zn-dependent insulinase-like peptidase